MSNGQSSRYHAEIKLVVQGKEARINVFADTLNEIFSDLAKITIQFDELHSQAKREILNAELKSQQVKPPASSKKLPPTVPDKAPTCLSCGSTNDMELIRWADKKTQEARSAWKCQACNEWYRPDGQA
jgi:hypothetical protein